MRLGRTYLSDAYHLEQVVLGVDLTIWIDSTPTGNNLLKLETNGKKREDFTQQWDTIWATDIKKNKNPFPKYQQTLNGKI